MLHRTWLPVICDDRHGILSFCRGVSGVATSTYFRQKRPFVRGGAPGGDRGDASLARPSAHTHKHKHLVRLRLSLKRAGALRAKRATGRLCFSFFCQTRTQFRSWAGRTFVLKYTKKCLPTCPPSQQDAHTKSQTRSHMQRPAQDDSSRMPATKAAPRSHHLTLALPVQKPYRVRKPLSS